MARALCCLPLCLKCISPDIASFWDENLRSKWVPSCIHLSARKCSCLLCELNYFHSASATLLERNCFNALSVSEEIHYVIRGDSNITKTSLFSLCDFNLLGKNLVCICSYKSQTGDEVKVPFFSLEKNEAACFPLVQIKKLTLSLLCEALFLLHKKLAQEHVSVCLSVVDHFGLAG